MLKKKILLLAVAVVTCGIVHAQQPDLGQWTDIGIYKKLNQRFTVYLEEEVRFFQNISRINLFYTNLGVSYKINKTFKVALTYRLNEKNQNDIYLSNRHRVYADIWAKHKFGKIFDCSYRCRLQGQVRDYYSSEHGHVPETYWRNKFDVDFDLGQKYTPYLAAEFRYQFHNPNGNQYADGKWVRGRYYIGCDYEINQVHKVGMYYMIQRDFNVNDPARDYIIGVAYTLSL